MTASQPEGSHTQWAIGQYTMSDHADMKINIDENFIRSAKEPAISAGVMIAKVSWNMQYTVSGIVNAEMRDRQLHGVMLVEHAVEQESC